MLALAKSLEVSAQGPTTYTVGIQVANLDRTNTANITITYYNQDGTVNTTFSDTIAPASSNTYFPIHPSDGFNGSAVISSDRRIAAIANILGDGGAFGGGSYDSFTQGATSAYVPLVLRNYYGISTWFNVQNTGSVDANVTVTYAGSPTPTCTETAAIKPGAAATFDQSTSACLADGFIGAATVTTGGADQTIAVAVVQIDHQSLLAYNGFTTAGSTNPVMPLVSHGYYNSRTAIQIQNTGTQSTDVTVTYTPSAGFPGQTCSETKTIPPGQSVNFGDTPLFEAPGYPCGPMTGGASGFVGSAKVTGNSTNQPLVAIVNSVTTGTPNAAAYSAFDAAMATDKVSLPLIMDRNYGIFTGFSIANVGTQPTTINCTFSGTTYTVSQTNVQPGAALTDVQLNKIADRYVGAAICTATGGDALIVGVVSQLGVTGDALLYYEGFNY
jgi:hypothetical protein